MSKIVNATKSELWGHSNRFSTFQLRSLITIDTGTHYTQCGKTQWLYMHIVYLSYSGLSALMESELII